MKILIDGMGGDNAPEAVVEGTVLAAAKTENELILVGPEKRLNELITKYKAKKELKGSISVIDAGEVITNNESPALAVRKKKDSTIVKGVNLLKEGEADIFISAGSTGALLAAGLFNLGRIRGIDRPAICSIYPIFGGKPSILCDAGANAECKPQNLYDFAVMSSVYMEKVIGRERPEVALVNIGTEEGKGNSLTKEAYGLLKDSGLNFKGNIEARDVPKGRCDVIVTDGFTGNVILKLTEGMAWNIFKVIKNKFTNGIHARLGSLLLVDKFMEIKKETDYSEYGGAPILGLTKPLVKMHGSSSAKGVKNTILKAIPFVEMDVVGKIQEYIK